MIYPTDHSKKNLRKIPKKKKIQAKAIQGHVHPIVSMSSFTTSRRRKQDGQMFKADVKRKQRRKSSPFLLHSSVTLSMFY